MGLNIPNYYELNDEQKYIISLPFDKNWVVKGGPGTEKTILAIYRAKIISTMAKGQKVLILVYNNP